MTRVREAVWHFHCPECGFGDRELGHLLGDDELHCVVCLEEESRTVVLRRWLAEAPDTEIPDAEIPGQARLRDAREAA